MAIRIPDTEKESLQLFIDLADDAVEKLRICLTNASPVYSSAQLAAQVAKECGLDPNVTQKILRVLMDLNRTREHHNLSVQNVIDGVAEEVSKTNLGNVQEDPAKISRLKQRLQAFLTLEGSFVTTSKAASILTQHKSIFTDARIFTDIRPIFTGVEETHAAAAVLVHNLQLVTRTDGRQLTLYVALDSNDLRALKFIIERALKKESALKDVLARSNLRYIEVPSS